MRADEGAVREGQSGDDEEEGGGATEASQEIGLVVHIGVPGMCCREKIKCTYFALMWIILLVENTTNNEIISVRMTVETK